MAAISASPSNESAHANTDQRISHQVAGPSRRTMPFDPIRSGQADDRGAVFRETINAADPRLQMWAFRAYTDCAFEYANGRTTPLNSDLIQDIDRNPSADPRKQSTILQLARAIERCKGFANLRIDDKEMVSVMRRAAEAGTLSALAALHLKFSGEQDSEQKMSVAERVVTTHDGDPLALEYAASYLAGRLALANPDTDPALVKAAYAQAVCQIDNYCVAPNNYLRLLDVIHQKEFSTVDEAHRTLFPSAAEQAQLRALLQSIRTALLRGDVRYFGLGGQAPGRNRSRRRRAPR